MNKSQIKDELIKMNDSLNLIDSQFLKLKTAIYDLEKMGFKLDEFYELMDEVGMPFYKLKTKSRDFIKDVIKKISKEE